MYTHFFNFLITYLNIVNKGGEYFADLIGNPDRVVTYTKAAVVLHNYLRVNESSVYCPPGFVDGEDGDGNVVTGNWRIEEDVCNGLTCVGQVLEIGK